MGFVASGKIRHIQSKTRRRSADVVASEQEFARLYTDSYKLVYNYVRYRMGGDEAAEDVVSEAYLQAARHFESYDPSRAKFSTWVIKIAINCMHTYKRKARPSAPLEDIPERLVAQGAAEGEVLNKDYVDRLLSVLDESERELVLMKYHEGYRNVEIAEELDMNPSTVSTKLANALAKMRVAAERDA